MNSEKFIPYDFRNKIPETEMLEKSKAFLEQIKKRRTIRNFSDASVPEGVIENCLLSAATAPSGANLQPWSFVVVSDNFKKKEIRTLAEKEEEKFYNEKAPKEWLEALAPLGTNSDKSFLGTAPLLIVIFEEKFRYSPEGKILKNYYVQESVGIATGILIAALNNAGLSCLTYTPSPMNFLNKVLERPDNEKPYLILVTGFPAPDALVPNISKKQPEEIISYFR